MDRKMNKRSFWLSFTLSSAVVLSACGNNEANDPDLNAAENNSNTDVPVNNTAEEANNADVPGEENNDEDEEVDKGNNENDVNQDEDVNKGNHGDDVNQNDNNEEQTNEESEKADADLKEKAETVVEALEEKDYHTLADMTHKRGALFSPYINIDTEQDPMFSPEEISEFAETEETYNWGVQDGTGEDIVLTPADYHEQYLFARDFTEADEIEKNANEGQGHMPFNGDEIYPEAEYVAFHVEEDPEELNWASLHLGFEKDDGDYQLVAVLVDRWTI